MLDSKIAESIHGRFLHSVGRQTLDSFARASFYSDHSVIGDHAHAAIVLHLLSRLDCDSATTALRAAEVCFRCSAHHAVINSVVLIHLSRVAHAGLFHLRQFKWLLDPVFAVSRLGLIPVSLSVADLLAQEYVLLVHIRKCIAAGACPCAGAALKELLWRLMQILVDRRAVSLPSALGGLCANRSHL